MKIKKPKLSAEMEKRFDNTFDSDDLHVTGEEKFKDFFATILEEQRKEFEDNGWLNQKCKGCGASVSYCDRCNKLWES